MPDIRMYDYLPELTPNYSDTALDVVPHKILTETGWRNQVIHLSDDDSEERISLGDSMQFAVELQWYRIREAEAGTVLDFFYDPLKGNGVGRTFKWDHPDDGHTYVVRFDGDITRELEPAGIHGLSKVRLKVLGKVLDGS